MDRMLSHRRMTILSTPQPSARIAIPAPEHTCRYDHKSPATRTETGVRARNVPAGAYGPDNVKVYRFVKT
jgi:hypothetical protein